MTSAFVTVANIDDIPKGANRAFNVDGHDILLCAVGDEIYALKNVCTHQLSSLEGGAMRGCYLFCPVHGARFDVRDGSTRGKLTKTPLTIYPVRVRDGRVEVRLELVNSRLF